MADPDAFPLFSRRSVTENTTFPLLKGSAKRLAYGAYAANCDGTRLLVGPHLIDGDSGQVITLLDDPNRGGNGAFRSEINALNCDGDVAVLSSFRGLHLYRNQAFVRTIDVESITGSDAFYPFGKIALNCAGDRILVAVPNDASRLNHSVVLLDDAGELVHRYPHFADPVASAEATSATYGISVALNCRGDRILVGSPAAHNERGKVELYDDSGALLQRLDCQACPSGAHFGGSVDLNADGNILLATVRSQDTSNETDSQEGSERKLWRRRRSHGRHRQLQQRPSDPADPAAATRRHLVPWRPNRRQGLRAVAYMFDESGTLLQTFKYDERQMDDHDTEWRGRLNSYATQVVASSVFGRQTRTYVFNATGHIVVRSRKDMVVEISSDGTRGVGHGNDPEGIYVYELTTSQDRPSLSPGAPPSATPGGGSAGVGAARSPASSPSSAPSYGTPTGGGVAGLVLLVLAVLVAGLLVVRRRRRKHQDLQDLGGAKAIADTRAADTWDNDDDDDLHAVELPPVS